MSNRSSWRCSCATWARIETQQVEMRSGCRPLKVPTVHPQCCSLQSQSVVKESMAARPGFWQGGAASQRLGTGPQGHSLKHLPHLPKLPAIRKPPPSGARTAPCAPPGAAQSKPATGSTPTNGKTPSQPRCAWPSHFVGKSTANDVLQRNGRPLGRTLCSDAFYAHAAQPPRPSAQSHAEHESCCPRQLCKGHSARWSL